MNKLYQVNYTCLLVFATQCWKISCQLACGLWISILKLHNQK